MTTRREIVRAGAGLAAIIAAGKAPAALVRTLIAARNTMMGGGGWKNPYITDGLVAMWDAEWNAGPGSYDAAAASWVDLSGNGHDAVCTNITWQKTGDICFASFDGTAYAVANPFSFAGDGIFTIEIVFLTTATSSAILVSNRSNTNTTGILIYAYYAATGGSDTLRAGNQYVYGGRRSKGTIIKTVARADGSTIRLNSTSKAETAASFATTSPFYIGASKYNNSTEQRNLGEIYSIRVYSKSLSADELDANKAVDSARFSLT